MEGAGEQAEVSNREAWAPGALGALEGRQALES
jgi:hypothetical protein